ncbi:LemA family protein [Ramlibacter alkalitolerans]|uniref:LemA family protein n=1 Tax=Ramlibacter alkalitolerans TaxID=2039631 RepID=A0ABS1JPT0_9BURK|nr:LemA family protein [Ramlibacter alkalitolerans]MBL0426274.1 LemA family protein [Ramlibacter alkalitolerans]
MGRRFSVVSATWIVVAALAALVVWIVAAFNALVQRRNRIANAYAQIDVQLKRRYDLIPNLVEVAKRYLTHEASTLEAVARARGAAVTAAAAARARPTDAAVVTVLAAAERDLGGSMGRLMAVAEAYPELKADATMQSLSEELTSTENRIGFARQAYNDEVLAYNDAAMQFPTLVAARLFGFAPAAMMQSTQNAQEREAPRLAF